MCTHWAYRITVDDVDAARITTRVPLLIQLRSTCAPSEEEHAIVSLESDPLSSERIYLHEIASKIEEMTEELAGTEQDVVDKPVSFTDCS